MAMRVLADGLRKGEYPPPELTRHSDRMWREKQWRKRGREEGESAWFRLFWFENDTEMQKSRETQRRTL
jgi:hypothetical protein